MGSTSFWALVARCLGRRTDPVARRPPSEGQHCPEERSDWERIESEMMDRHYVLETSYRGLKFVEHASPLLRYRMAATDIFVEKAQARLTTRANWFYFAGTLSVLIAIGALGFLAAHLYRNSPVDMLGAGAGKAAAVPYGYLLTTLILKMVSLGGLVVALEWILISLGRAFFHEGTVLYGRRHALRFGRLSIHLFGGNISSDEAKNFFSWNEDLLTAFKDIQPDSLKGTGLAKLLDTPPEMLKALAEVLASAAKLKAK